MKIALSDPKQIYDRPRATEELTVEPSSCPRESWEKRKEGLSHILGVAAKSSPHSLFTKRRPGTEPTSQVQ